MKRAFKPFTPMLMTKSELHTTALKINNFSRMKIFFLVLCLSFSPFTQTGCTENTPEIDNLRPDEKNKLSTIELIKDSNFQKGFIQQGNNSSNVTHIKIATDAKQEPDWLLSQWFSDFVLTDDDLVLISENSYKLENDANKISITKDDDGNSVLSFFTSGRLEWGENTVRTDGEAWPHFLFSQNINNCPPLNELEKIMFKTEVRVKSWIVNFPELYDPRIHAVRFRLNFVVKNINKNSEAYNDFFWFVMTFFDNRHLFMPETGKLDEGNENKKGSGKYIYGADAKQYLSKSLHQLDWVSIDVDVLPLVKKGLQNAQKGGYLPISDNLGDYVLSGFNFGYELTANIDIESQIKNLSVTAFSKED